MGNFKSTEDMYMFFGLITILVLVGSIGSLIIFLKNKKRIKEIKDYCTKQKLKYTESDNYIPNCKEQFVSTTVAIFNEYTTIMQGVRSDISFCILDYLAYVKSNKYKSTICLLSKSGISIPDFYIRREMPITDKINEKLGMQDIDFADDKEFSDNFVLQGSNEKEIRKFFTPTIRKAVKNIFANDYIDIEVSKDYFIVSHKNHIDLKQRLELLNNSIKLFSTMLSKNN